MIKYRKAFERDPAAGFDGLFNWDFLKGAFGPQIMPMDFDGVVERFGHFLIFETKDPGVHIPAGQMRALRELVRHEEFTVIFCAKRPEQISTYTILTKHGVSERNGGAAGLRAFCELWYTVASEGQR